MFVDAPLEPLSNLNFPRFEVERDGVLMRIVTLGRAANAGSNAASGLDGEPTIRNSPLSGHDAALVEAFALDLHPALVRPSQRPLEQGSGVYRRPI